MLTLVVIKSPASDYMAGTVYKIDGSTSVTLGRGSKADIRIKYPKLSREHIQFVPTSRGWCIKELGSTNGSQLNGGDIEAIEPLRVGDRIRAGKFLFNVAEVSAPLGGPKQIDVTSNIDEEEDNMATQHFSSSEEDDMIAELEDLFD